MTDLIARGRPIVDDGSRHAARLVALSLKGSTTSHFTCLNQSDKCGAQVKRLRAVTVSGLVGNQPPHRFLSRVAIDQTQNKNLDSKVRVKRDRNGHREQETRALKATEREHQNP
jgi:hypothetical protein